jgi:NAD(P)-dependent dehydrogenase (short-subunit alcohol dehydrogenase family)
MVTGAIRGIGKAIATMAAEQGANVVITYRDPAKQRRALQVQKSLYDSGVSVQLSRFDITDVKERQNALTMLSMGFGKLSALVLNAAGGLEAERGLDYAMLVNRDANIALVNECIERGLLGEGSWIIYLTSTWAHLYGKEPTPEFYLPVASTKNAAEKALLEMQTQLSQKGIGVGVVVAPVVSDTGAYLIMKTRFKESLNQAQDEPVVPPAAVAEAVLAYLDGDLSSGQVTYV